MLWWGANLLIQIFQTAIGCVDALEGMRSTHKDIQNPQLKLRYAKYRFLVWGELCGLRVDGEALGLGRDLLNALATPDLGGRLTNQLVRGIATTTLRHVNNIFSDTSKLGEKYGIEKSAVSQSTSDDNVGPSAVSRNSSNLMVFWYTRFTSCASKEPSEIKSKSVCNRKQGRYQSLNVQDTTMLGQSDVYEDSSKKA
jgi:hypothetical protein